METKEEIANKFVNSFGEVLPGFKYGHKFTKEYSLKYYFDFIFLNLDGSTPKEPPIAGGAVGFTIDKYTGKIEPLSFGDLGQLDAKEREINEVYENLLSVKQGSGSLNWLKTKFNLDSKSLLEFKKIINQTDLDKNQIILQLEKIKTNANT